jgi:hypothetical protein
MASTSAANPDAPERENASSTSFAEEESCLIRPFMWTIQRLEVFPMGQDGTVWDIWQIPAWAAESRATTLSTSVSSTAASTTMMPASAIWSRRAGPPGFVARSATATMGGC